VFLILFLLFTSVTLVELWLIIEMARLISWPATIGVAIVSGIIGSAMVKREGLSVLQRGMRELQSGRFPAGPIAEGGVLLVGGAFLITPGILTDVVGLSTLVPVCRRFYGRTVVSWARRNLTMTGGAGGPGFFATFGGGRPFEGGPGGGSTGPAGPGGGFEQRTSRRVTEEDEVVDVEFKRVD